MFILKISKSGLHEFDVYTKELVAKIDEPIIDMVELEVKIGKLEKRESEVKCVPFTKAVYIDKPKAENQLSDRSGKESNLWYFEPSKHLTDG